MAAARADVYDFDHTIYKGDSSLDFILFCMLRRPKLWKHFPRQVYALTRYLFGSWSRGRVKQEIFIILRDIDDINPLLSAFWAKYERRITGWYRREKKDTDIIISASPEFLLKPIARRLGVKLIATIMEPSTGLIIGKNCQGAEKARRLQQYDTAVVVNACYSDSLSDMPLFKMARHSFIVARGSRAIPLSEYKPSKLAALGDPAFLRFLVVGGINASLGILFSYVISLLITSPLLAFALGYSISLVISYFLNAAVTFKEVAFSLKQFRSFCLSYMPNFAILFVVVHLFVNVLQVYPLFAYISAAVVAAPITFLLLRAFTFKKRRHR